jgi:hypothetical protein
VWGKSFQPVPGPAPDFKDPPRTDLSDQAAQRFCDAVQRINLITPVVCAGNSVIVVSDLVGIFGIGHGCLPSILYFATDRGFCINKNITPGAAVSMQR